MKINKGKRTLEASEKAYRIYYKGQGYKIVDEKEEKTPEK